MGRQTYIYFSQSDVAEFSARMTSDYGAVLLPHRLSSNFAEPVGSITRDLGNGRRSLGYLVRAEDIERIRPREIPSQDSWTVDEHCSPVVEFDGGFTDSTKILRGRLYFITGYYDEENRYVEKSGAFIRWADRILAAAKRSGQWSRMLRATVGSNAQVLHGEGCKLETPY